MKQEYDIHRTMRDKYNAIGLCEKTFLTGVNVLEFVNKKYNPFEFKLDGYSKEVKLNIGTYKEIFSELYDKHKDKSGKWPPEFRFLLTFFTGAVGFHGIKLAEEQDELEIPDGE